MGALLRDAPLNDVQRAEIEFRNVLGESDNWSVVWNALNEDVQAEIIEIMEVAKNRMSLPVTPNLKQFRVLIDPSRGMHQAILFGGAMGGGKSALLCMSGISAMRKVPNNKGLLTRATFSAMRISTLIELESMAALCPDMVHQKGEHRFWFPRTGSYLYYMGAGRPHERQRIRSSQWGWIGVDEITELDLVVWNELSTRLRWGPAALSGRTSLNPNGELQVIGTCNPEPGWVKEQWITDPLEGFKFIKSLPADNPHLNGGDYQGYIDSMEKRMPPEWVEAFIHGNWDAFVPSDAAIPEPLVAAARARSEIPDYGDVVCGLDVARKGDDWTKLYRRCGLKWDMQLEHRKLRTTETVERVINWYRATWPKPRRINVDDDGVGGGVSDGLIQAQQRGELGECVIGEVNAMGRSDDTEHYFNKKAELTFILRALLENGRGDLPNDPRLAADLTTARYSMTGKRIAVEPKELVKRRLGRSPDDGDALVLTMYEGRQDYVPYRTVNEILDDESEDGRLDVIREQTEMAEDVNAILGRLGFNR